MLTADVRKPRQSLDLTLRRQKISEDQLAAFRAARQQLLAALNAAESEEHNKQFIADFLRAVGLGYHTNTRGKRDLVIRTGPKATDPEGVIIETKSPTNKGEMVTPDDLNRAALHEALLYYLQDRASHAADDLRRLIITNGRQWFIFDAHDFDRLFWRPADLRQQYQQWAAGQKAGKGTAFFYQDIARPHLAALDAALPVTVVDLKGTGEHQPTDATLAKLFSPAHLLKEGATADPNTLDRHFYEELLYLIGLEEVKDKGRRLIKRVAPERRQPGALLENALVKIAAEDRLRHARPDLLAAHGATPPEQAEGVALALCLMWVNRLLFLKLLEGQLRRYHPDHDAHFRFLDPERLKEFDDVQALFFEVLNVPVAQRPPDPEDADPTHPPRFREVPYLNSSLFERAELEHAVMDIANLRDRRTLPLLKGSVLTPRKGDDAPPDALRPSTLKYLLRFLDAYDFASEAAEDEVVSGAPKRLISAAVLGLIFEKINGYRDGSFYTPGFVTMYICRHTLRRAVVRHFTREWPFLHAADVPELAVRLQQEQPLKRRAHFAAHFNRLTVLDPAVGSGHFLVSALNELLAIKSELGLFLGDDGRPLPYRLKVEHDELLVEDLATDQLVRYRVAAFDPATGARTVAQQATTLQRALFREKRALMEHTLFGVDLNPNSVRICRLRLWIELLKHAYYRPEAGFGELETLPNLDLNIRAGNSLLSRHPLSADLTTEFGESGFSTAAYGALKDAYFTAAGRAARNAAAEAVEAMRQRVRTATARNTTLAKQKADAEGLYACAKALNADQFGRKFNSLEDQQLERRRLELMIQKLTEKIEATEHNPLFRDAFEWRYEFPEVLAPADEQENPSRFVGFDVVIGNPPYIRQEELTAFKPHFERAYKTYNGTADLYVYFIERGLQLLRKGGELSFIAPNKWLRAGYGARLRRWLGNYRILEFVDFGDLPVFPEATTYPAILTVERAEPAAGFVAATLSALPTPDTFDAAVTAALTVVDAARLADDGWNLGAPDQQDLLDKLRAAGTPLGEYVGGKMYRGILTGLNEAFVIDETTRNSIVEADPRSADVIKPFVAGRDVKRYRQPLTTQHLLYIPWAFDIDAYPVIKKHLERYYDQLSARPEVQQKRYPWYALGRYASDYVTEFDQPKIIWQEIATYQSFGFDQQKLYSNNKTFFIPLADFFLLGVLNAKPAWFFFNQVAGKMAGGALAMQSTYVSQLPIPRATPEQQAAVAALVQQVLAAKAADPAADTAALETQIDERVAALYGLSAQEAAALGGG